MEKAVKQNKEYLIIGLGNPGKKYKNTRHNAGFLAVDLFSKRNNFPKFKENQSFKCLITEKDKLVLAKPQTFMNNSGEAVKQLSSFFKIKYENIIVFHDDLDISLGSIKISKKHGSGGHKGINSIINALKTNSFVRIRIGIKPIKNSAFPRQNFVLEKFSWKEKGKLRASFKKSCQAAKIIIEEGIEKAMSLFNH